MAAEVEEIYPLENDLPQPPGYPDAIDKFHQHHAGRYPDKVIVNQALQVEWREYFIPTKLTPSIKPLETQEIEDWAAQGYHITIEYDKDMDVKTIKCRGFATSN